MKYRVNRVTGSRQKIIVLLRPEDRNFPDEFVHLDCTLRSEEMISKVRRELDVLNSGITEIQAACKHLRQVFLDGPAP